MGTQTIFHKTVIIGALLCSFGLSGCAWFSEDEHWSDVWPEDTIVVAEEETVTTEPDSTTVQTTSVVCDNADGSCAPTDDYLTTRFVQEKTLTDDHDEALLSVSRPAGAPAMSVRDKMIAPTDGTETIFFTPVAVPEKETTDVSVAESVPDQPQPALPQTHSVTIETEPQPIQVETTTETAVQVEPGRVPPTERIVEVVPAGVVPLKKVTTTITETTTKYQKERAVNPTGTPETLAEKIAYGEEIHDWDANSGNTLRRLLLDWGATSGWTVIWKLDRDYRLEAGVIFRGTFIEVSSALIRSFARATPAPIGTFYQGNRVLVISTQEDDNDR